MNTWSDSELREFQRELRRVIAWTEGLAKGFDHSAGEYGHVFRRTNPVVDGEPLYLFEGGSASWGLDRWSMDIYDQSLDQAKESRNVGLNKAPLLIGEIGRILCFETCISTADGAPNAESLNFMDEIDAPPIDTWLYLMRDYDHGDHKCKQTLFCWIPKAFEAVVQRAIAVEILDSYRWMDENDPEAYEWIADRMALGSSTQLSIESLLKHGYVCHPEPPYEGGIEGFIRELKALFSSYFDPGYVAEEFKLPREFSEFLETVEGSYFRGNWAGLFGMEGIYNTTKYQLELWEPGPENPVLWIDVGNWSDKHNLVMCVSKSHPDFGKVIDAYDDHPYCSEDFYNFEEWAGIDEYAMGPE
ncbi:MAG: hypothetical protein U0176_14065 [Bacteroidia bacterium]